MFNEVYKLNNNDLQTININELISTPKNLLNLDFSEQSKVKRVSMELSKKYTKNLINNSYDCYIYEIDHLYCLIGKKDFHDSDEIMKDMTLLTNQLSNLSRDVNKKNIALQEANRRVESLLRHDKLTGLSNRRHFMEYIKKAIATAHRHKNPLTLVMCDLDYFKEINDN
jgi:predicted signal transduction protein with EAL and GGDEF domain